ncbi:MAG: GNAT family N-acetyltransferase [Chloroflexi bacterium]|nr:GNAT family N-acetyltransferase [Chloroflexota bacterium]
MYKVSPAEFDSVSPAWSQLLRDRPDCPVFLTPQWQRTWWENFGTGNPLLIAVREGDSLAGVAPLMRTETGISLLGSSDVCDYLDIVAAPGGEQGACQALAGYLLQLPWQSLDFFSLHAESVARRHFLPAARASGLAVQEELEDVCPQRELPATWEEYLASLSAGQRHELKRKMRRMASESGVAWETVTGGQGLDKDMDDFFRLFLDSREAKGEFLTPQMKRYFRSLVEMTARYGWLRLFFLKVSGERIASAIAFDYGNTYYLYNSGYDKRFSGFAVGLLLKAKCIEAAIAAGKKRFDFLRGREPYKYDLGGIDREVYRCRITRGTTTW